LHHIFFLNTEDLRVIPLIKLQYIDYLVINYTQPTPLFVWCCCHGDS